MVELKFGYFTIPELRRANYQLLLGLYCLCGNMGFRLIIRGEIPSILKISGSLGKAFSADKLDTKWLDFVLLGLEMCSVYF